MSKYEKLKSILASRKQGEWRVSFAGLEKLLGISLPTSAYKYPAWWSNNPANNSMTKAWLNAGWCTEQVDVPGQTVVFRRMLSDETATTGHSYAETTKATCEGPTGMMEAAHMFDNNEKPTGSGIFAKLFGCMKGTVKVAPGVNLAAGLFTDDELKSFDEKWDRLLTTEKTGTH